MATKSKKPGASLPSDLREPIFIETHPGVGLLGTKPLTEAEITKNVTVQANKRLEAFLGHYGMPLNSSNKYKLLSCYLLQELGWMNFVTEPQPSAGAPRIWLADGSALIKRMDEIIRETSLKPLPAAKVLRKKYPDDYHHLTAKSLSNRYSELKQRDELSLAVMCSPKEYRNAVGRKIRRLRGQIKRLRSKRDVAGKENHDLQKKKRPGKDEIEALVSQEKYFLNLFRSLASH